MELLASWLFLLLEILSAVKADNCETFDLPVGVGAEVEV